jgi:HSP20 family protein
MKSELQGGTRQGAWLTDGLPPQRTAGGAPARMPDHLENSMANITRFDPLSELVSFSPFRSFDDYFRVPRMRSLLRDLPSEPEIKIDVSEDDKAYHVKAEVPGVKKDDIRVAIEGSEVSITAEVKKEKEEKKGERLLRSERYYGMQTRSFTVMHDIDQTRPKPNTRMGSLSSRCRRKATAAS